MMNIRNIFISLHRSSTILFSLGTRTTLGYMMLNLLVKHKDIRLKVEWYTRVGRTSIV
jgi:hypothetical protein